jgi:pyridoxal phosphate enzyme (YggS family)
MTDIAKNIRSLKEQIPDSVQIVAVSKTKPVEDILAAYNSGHRIFGENRVKEFIAKKDLLPADIEWHFIGHLQTNKVKYVVQSVSMIESVDSYKLLKTINTDASAINIIVNSLIQIHIAEETSKYGFSMDEIHEMLNSEGFSEIRSVRICGVMGMATFTDDPEQIRKEFRYLVQCYSELKERYYKNDTRFKEISMGMSGDYKIAVEEGSTILRIGSLIFGERK